MAMIPIVLEPALEPVLEPVSMAMIPMSCFPMVRQTETTAAMMRRWASHIAKHHEPPSFRTWMTKTRPRTWVTKARPRTRSCCHRRTQDQSQSAISFLSSWPCPPSSRSKAELVGGMVGGSAAGDDEGDLVEATTKAAHPPHTPRAGAVARWRVRGAAPGASAPQPSCPRCRSLPRMWTQLLLGALQDAAVGTKSRWAPRTWLVGATCV